MDRREPNNAQGQFRDITKYIPALEQCTEFGRWVFDSENPTDPNAPRRAPYVRTEPIVFDVVDAVLAVAKNRPELELMGDIRPILQNSGLEWKESSMKQADESKLDAQCIMALILWVIRAERFSDGTVVRFFKNGCMLRWLKRLEELDRVQAEPWQAELEKIMMVPNPKEAMLKLYRLAYIENMGLVDMEEAMQRYAVLHEIDDLEMMLFPNGERVINLDAHRALTAEDFDPKVYQEILDKEGFFE